MSVERKSAVGLQTQHQENARLYQTLQETEDPLALKGLLAKIKRRFYQTNTQGKNPLLMPIKRLTKQAGFHHHSANTPLFVESLEQANIPTGSISQ